MQRRRAHGKRDPHTYRKTAIFGITTCHSEKRDKRNANRLLRAQERTWMACDEPDYQVKPAPAMREATTVWAFGKDGKKYYGWESDPTMRRPVEYWHR